MLQCQLDLESSVNDSMNTEFNLELKLILNLTKTMEHRGRKWKYSTFCRPYSVWYFIPMQSLSLLYPPGLLSGPRIIAATAIVTEL